MSLRDRLDAGFDPELIVEKTDDGGYKEPEEDPPVCAICTNVCEEPSEASCSHVFCKVHIQEWLRTHDTCPLDRTTITLRERPSDTYLALLDKLMIKCRYHSRGCDHLTPLDSVAYRTHVDECGYGPVRCSWPNCPEKSVNRRDLDEHLANCPFRVVSCDLKCGVEMPFNKLETHRRDVCPNLPLECPQGCGEIVNRGLVEEHKANTCPNTMLPCPIEPCANVLRRHVLPSHQVDPVSMAQHMAALSARVSAMEASQQVVTASQQSRIRQLERRCWARLQPASLAAHNTRVSALAASGDRLYTGSWDTTIKVWSLPGDADHPATCLMTFYGHDDWVRTLTVKGDRLFSGSKDKTIKIWDLTVGPERAYAACLVTLSGHTGVVTVLSVNEDCTRLFSSSWDNTIRIWDIQNQGESATCVATLQGHEDWGRALTAAGNVLFSGAKDYSIKAWDIEGAIGGATSSVGSFEGHTGVLTSLLVGGRGESRNDAVGERLFSASWDNTIRMWDISGGRFDGVCLAVFQGHTDDVTALVIQGDWLFSGSDDNTIRVWDTANATVARCIKILSVDRVIALTVSDDRLFSSSSDDTVKIWQ